MARPPGDAQYSHVQALSRGLALLHALNQAEQGWASIAELSAHTGLHRTTVRRLLETLQADGYVRRSASDDSYRLNLKVRQLSDGFTDAGDAGKRLALTISISFLAKNAQAFSSTTVGQRDIHDLALDLEQVSNFFKGLSELQVVHMRIILAEGKP